VSQQLLRLDAAVFQGHDMLCAFADVWCGVLCNGAGLCGEDHVLPVWSGVWQYLLVSLIQLGMGWGLQVQHRGLGFRGQVYETFSVVVCSRRRLCVWAVRARQQ
jgi:hypothetical protein